jgi:hypothetical protein
LKVSDNFVDPEHVSVLFVHIEEVDCVRRFVTIEHAFFHDRHFKAVGATIDTGRTHATTRAFPDQDDAIDVMCAKRLLPEAARSRRRYRIGGGAVRSSRHPDG